MSEAKERPIVFSGRMVRAILAGRKTQTRRVVKGMALDWLEPKMFSPEYVACLENGLSPYGYPGDRLWVRETGSIAIDKSAFMFNDAGGVLSPSAPVGSESWCREWKTCPSIHMPRWASRIILEIVGVRVERLMSITESDSQSEGVDWVPFSHRDAFEDLWDAINAKRGYPWANNPWVWVIEFRNISGVGLHASQQPHAVDFLRRK